MKRLFLAALALGLLNGLAVAGPIPDTTVSLPLGDWLAASAGFLEWLVPLLVLWAFRFLPGGIAGILKTAHADQLLAKAIDYGINTVVGAAKDKVLSADVGEEVIAQALTYSAAYGPKWLLTWLGGEAGIRARIIARLDLHPDVGIAPVGLLLQAPARALTNG